MKITKQARREAKAIFKACTTDGMLNEPKVREAVAKIIEAKPRGYLAILSHFQRLVKLDIDRRTAQVESAQPLDKALQENVRANLGKLYGPGLQIHFGVNPALIAGLRIKVGSDVYDGSVQSRLQRLHEQF
jgi:F-type H+-transporting ATPase subunit delta